jgi:hypothetical protein
VDDFLHPVVDGLQLYGNWCGSRCLNSVLHCTNTHDPGMSQFLLLRVDLVTNQIKVKSLRNCFRGLRQVKRLCLRSVKDTSDFLSFFLGDVFAEYSLDTGELSTLGVPETAVRGCSGLWYLVLGML